MHYKIEAAQKDLDKYQEQLNNCEELLLFTENLFPNDSVSVNYSGVIYVYATVDTKDQAFDALIAYSKAGYHQVLTTNKTSTGFVYWLGKEKGKLLLQLNLSFSGIKCRQVQVGTREIPVYELVCDGEKPEEPQMPEIEPIEDEIPF